MKSISASIIVLAASIMLTGGAFIQHGDTKSFVMFVAAAVGLSGLFVWFAMLKTEA